MTIKTSKTSLSQEDSDLFRQAVGDTRPLPTVSERHTQRPLQKPLPKTNRTGLKINRDDLLGHAHDINELETNEQLVYLGSGLQKQILRKLRRGQFPIEDQLDLHGLKQQSAEELILDFINHAKHSGYRCINIIHGKGLRSKNPRPVLKTLCNHLLRRHPTVLAFISAKPADGGSGAVIVLLKNNKNQPENQSEPDNHQI
ncbi:MAG: Smr/MutS family protein [Xanthomonadales bacterium]|nr:Smr/MutS family protein [Xanthomonadales bacterium]